jgi:hypothetical protein
MRFIHAKSISQYPFVLTAAAIATQGEIACGDSATGKVVPAGVSTTLLPLGFFDGELVGDGTAKVSVRLFEEVHAYTCANDAVAPVANAFQTVYLQDGGSVSALETGTSIAGIALEVTPADVLLGTLSTVLVVFRRLGAA